MQIDEKLLPSNKKFGYFFTIVFFIIFLYFFYYSNAHVYGIFLGLTVVTLLLTIFSPNRLIFFNKIWFKIGILLNTIVSPLILGIIFFVLITPVSIFFKIIRRDYLNIKSKHKDSYWIITEEKKLDKNSLKQQY